jgi:hypothetical protein
MRSVRGAFRPVLLPVRHELVRSASNRGRWEVSVRLALADLDAVPVPALSKQVNAELALTADAVDGARRDPTLFLEQVAAQILEVVLAEPLESWYYAGRNLRQSGRPLDASPRTRATPCRALRRSLCLRTYAMLSFPSTLRTNVRTRAQDSVPERGNDMALAPGSQVGWSAAAVQASRPAGAPSGSNYWVWRNRSRTRPTTTG